MKKILAIFLALIMILSITLVACQKNTATTSGGNADDGNDDGVEFEAQGNKKDTSDTSKNTDNKTGGWEAAAYTVYSMVNNLNVRSSTSTSDNSNVLGKLNIGEKVDATERNDDWYTVTYNGNTAYVSRDFVTLNAGEATFSRLSEPEVLMVNEAKKDIQVVLRTDPVITDDTYATVFKGTYTTATISKVGSNTNGSWYIVSYDADGVAGEGTAVEYYLAVGSATRDLFGLSSNQGSSHG